ncbi:M1 family aminopeptidase [Emticicia sp. BO119]|uniref:ABC transporter permease/M1 family aminopeptidase n=1 Tax=Emticicia sp. BO119 TaxID=2757768 RepID=UPI0015F0CF00|nr:M1 family aminopeptidase [Emticicia sp. BO119]MBA4850365.1 ABC transporter permease [Emticicia sp. BO119]
MKFLKIFRFELIYQLRSVTTWLYFAVVLSFAFLVVTENYSYDAREGYFLLNAPIVIATVMVLSIVHWLLIGASVAGNAATRDIQKRMHFLTYATPVSKGIYLGGRFLAAFILNVLILLAIPIGILFAIYFSGIEREILGTFRLASYLTAFFYILLPNVFISTAFQFSLAALSRRAIASYLGGLILFVAAYLFWMMLKDKGEWGSLVDPMSFTPIMNHQNDWSPIDKNTRLLMLEGSFLINRLLWLGISLGMLIFTYFRFRFVLPETSRKQKSVKYPKPGVEIIEEKLKWAEGGGLPKVRGTFGFASHLYQLRILTWKTFLQMAKNGAGLPLLAVLALLMGMAAPGDGNLKARGVPLFPRTDQVLHYLTGPLNEPKFFWIIMALLTIYYTGELLWREQETRLNEIVNVTPIAEWVLFLSRFLALSLLAIIWLVFVMLAGIVVQMILGGAGIEIGLYLQILFGLQLVDSLLFTLIVIFIHVLVNQKFIGHLVALLVYGFIVYAPNLGIEHKLLIFGNSPKWSYTAMAGFGNSLAPWIWFKMYWVAWALLLAIVTRLLWVRSRETGLIARLHLARHRFRSSTVLITAFSAGCILLSGGFIFYNTNVVNEYKPVSDTMKQRALYEQLYGQYKTQPQPLLIKTSLQVEIYPNRRETEIHGTYYLLNNTTITIDSIHVATADAVQTTNVSINRPSKQVLIDETLGHHIFILAKPLQPGDSLQLSFEVHHKTQGFTNNGADASVLANGTNFKNYDLLPSIGYQSHREINDIGQRKQYKLCARPGTPSLYDINARKNAPFTERIYFEAIIGTDSGQTAVAPGELRQSWTKGRRQYFHYITDAPIRNEYNILSARYAVYERYWKDIAIQIYYDPGQTENLERMMQSVQASLAYYAQQFGPYPYRQIKFISYPGYGSNNHSTPGTITTEEGFFLLNPKGDPRGFDLVTAVVAHEVAHQWWGGQLTPARVEGAGLLSESLAWYSAMGVFEDKYGFEQLHRLLDFLREENETPRTRAALPLLRADDWYQYYRKGPFVLYALSQYIDRNRVNNALRHLLVKHPAGSLPLPTSLALYRELKVVTPDSLHYLLHDFFEKNIFWQLETKEATAKKTKAGFWQVTLNIAARKWAVDTAGTETKLPMNDWIEIGVFAPAEAGKETGKQLYLQKRLIKSGQQSITVTVPQKPARVGIDPNHLLIEWEIEDNSKEVKLSN